MVLKLKEQIREFLQTALQPEFFKDAQIPPIEIERPNEQAHGDLSTNIALKSARIFRRPPLAIAEEFCRYLDKQLTQSDLGPYIESVSAMAPGFINFRFSKMTAISILTDVLTQKECYGRQTVGAGEKVQLEFVSANPTGPLSVAHARQAAVGDSLANILDFLGFSVTREYYINDGGNQIATLGRSVELRAYEIFGETVDFPEECYQGDYIRDMAQIFIDQNGFRCADDIRNLSDKQKRLMTFSADYLLDVIKEELDDFGVHFDEWTRESIVANPVKVQEVLEILQGKGFIKEEDGALWFLSTRFGDDKDRVVRKSDGKYTYLAPDIAYHRNKYERGFKKVYNFWGPDHHGYIPRIKAAVQALGYDEKALEVLIVQLATIYRNGQPVSMSTRKGEFISLREVLTEVGRDAARFFFLMRGISAHLDFDLELAKKETPENPVYYIQYAHARVYSIVAKASEAGLYARQKGFHLLREPEEIELLKKIGGFIETLLICQQQMDVFALVIYLQELATCFHRFYDKHRVVDVDNAEVSSERLSLIEAARIVLGNGLRLLGVSAPEKM